MFPISLMDLPAFFCFYFRCISSRLRLLGRLVSTSSLYYFVYLLTNGEPATGSMHPQPWQVRVCVVSPSHSRMKDGIRPRRRIRPSNCLPSLHNTNVWQDDVQMGRHARRADSSCHDSHTICKCSVFFPASPSSMHLWVFYFLCWPWRHADTFLLWVKNPTTQPLLPENIGDRAGKLVADLTRPLRMINGV